MKELVLAVLMVFGPVLMLGHRSQTPATVAVNVTFSAYWTDGTRCSCLITLSHPDANGNVIQDFQVDVTNSAGKFTQTLQLDPTVLYLVDIYSDYYQMDIVKAPANFPFPLSVNADIWMNRPTSTTGPTLNSGQSNITVTF